MMRLILEVFIIIIVSVGVLSTRNEKYPENLKTNTLKSLSKPITIISTMTTILSAKLAVTLTTENEIDRKMHKELISDYIKPNMKVLEVGFGNGANLDYYPKSIQLFGLDPKINEISNSEKELLIKKYKKRDIDLSLINGFCEKLPFDENVFDAVLSTLVFCSVDDPVLSLTEISRVLKFGSTFVCVEHILAEEGTLLAEEQKLLDPLQQIVADGCHLTRRTDQLLTRRSLGFSDILSLDYVQLSTQWPISRQIYAALKK